MWHLKLPSAPGTSMCGEVLRKTFDRDSGKRVRPEDSTAVRAETTVGEPALHAHGWPVGLRMWIDREERSQWWPEKWEDKGIVMSVERLLCAMLWKFTWVSFSNSYNNPSRGIRQWSLFCRWKNWVTEKVTQWAPLWIRFWRMGGILLCKGIGGNLPRREEERHEVSLWGPVR